MPRILPSLFWQARKEISPLAAQLLPACRDLESAAHELRWIREHVRDTKSPIPNKLRMWKLVEKRASGVPLQYVLGTQPFGDLEIKCRPGVLIPRPETEAYTLHLASLLSHSQHPPPKSLSILDLCTGTGCIPLLLLHSLLAAPSTRNIPIDIHGVDISPRAVRLARENQAHNTAVLRLLPRPASSSPSPSSSSPSGAGPRYTLDFARHDIFSPALVPAVRQRLRLRLRDRDREGEGEGEQGGDEQPGGGALDLLVSNPPYISPSDFAASTARAVRNHEPRPALVPDFHHHHHHLLLLHRQSPEAGDRRPYPYPYPYRCRPEDVFYARLREIAAALRPRRVLMEVGGWDQARRVVGLLFTSGDAGAETAETGDPEGGGGLEGYEVEIWRDEPAAGDRGERVQLAGREVVVRGVGNGRAVYLYR
ncbi:S-adenosyl-L-methionine-dependent methyltransferase [Thermothelomyces heterothallicus CBS 202.75]|uniref:S-adenosyl-L-methionine-dependent methyltransferase n=1 Tax=Thermothelomyces heterothallicus CBS 202.75 TaxID=1149848 RepID=UPI0037432B77